jgi:hypothetical protein
MISVREPNLGTLTPAIGGTILLLGDREGAQFILKFLSRVLNPFPATLAGNGNKGCRTTKVRQPVVLLAQECDTRSGGATTARSHGDQVRCGYV